MSNREPIEIFTSIDCEFNQPSGKIIEIGYVIGNIRTGEILHENSIFVNPLEEISQYITDLTSITQNDVVNAVLLPEAYEVLKADHLKYKSFVNPITWGSGDTKAIKDELGMKDDYVFGRRWLDVKTVWVTFRLAHGKPIQGGLAKSMTKLALRFEGKKHRAIDDSRATFQFYCKLCEMMREIKTYVRN